MFRRKHNKRKAFTLVEIVVVVAITGVLVPIILTFLWRGYSLNRRAEGAMLNQRKARRIIDKVKRELREARTGEGNQYPLEVCEGLEIVYYSDIDQDASTERIRYFLDGTTFKRGVVEPSGEAYNSGSEQVIDIMTGILNSGGTPIFSYYNSDYAGSGSALADPVDCGEVSLLNINFLIDTVIELQPGAFQVSSNIQFRNLKNNL